MLQQGGRGEEARGGVSPSFALTESTSHSARATGGKAREGERERERERERPCACLPCVRVDCTTASRSPFLQAAML